MEETTEKVLEALKRNAENNEKILNKLEDFPITECSILALYRQTHAITLIGLPNASLIMQGVLMEEFIKYLYFHHKRKDFDGELWELIAECHKECLFSKDSKKNDSLYKFFDDFRKSVRNIQVHFLAKKQTKNLGVMGMKLQFPHNSDGKIDAENFLEILRDAKENFNKRCELLPVKDNPAIASPLKLQLDSNAYLDQFCELIKAFNIVRQENSWIKE